MLVVLSPAKRMDFTADPTALPSSKPQFLTEAHKLIDRARDLSQGDIKKLMNLSDDLAEVNFKRFKAFKKKASAQGSKQAVLAFNGDVYLGLEAASLSEADLNWAQGHLRILSGLYGVLRPLDTIQPYRLEMGRALSNSEGKDLYAWWGEKLARSLNKAARAHDHPVIVNLASNEYFTAARADKIKVEIITPTFRDIKDGKARTLSFFAKKARGSLAREIIKGRIESPQALKTLKVDDYTYRDDMSAGNKWVFARKQPPPAGG
jgi:uncharacterized protein